MINKRLKQRLTLLGLGLLALALILLLSRPGLETGPVAQHGQLAVAGAQIVDQRGQPVALAGPSLFWANNNWGGERFYNPQVVREVAEDWDATLIRAAMGVEPDGGYLDDPDTNRAKVETVVEAAIAEGIYVLIDWHAHHAERHPQEAVRFFQAMARQYGDQPNVIYEIYNEPLADADWSTTIKPYAERVIGAIRALDPDNLIVVGTPTWSQDVDVAARNPITDFDNIAYALHFYAGTHKQALRDKALEAMESGVALMVTEWGTVNADGDGAVDRESTRAWVDFMREHNLSHATWALNDKAEGASMLKPGTATGGGWTNEDLTESGRLVRSIIRHW